MPIHGYFSYLLKQPKYAITAHAKGLNSAQMEVGAHSATFVRSLPLWAGNPVSQPGVQVQGVATEPLARFDEFEADVIS